jgi:hypothetical protein
MSTRKLILAIWLVIFAVSLQGCGLTVAQRKEIETFGQAVAVLGASSKEQLVAGRENVIDMKRYRLAIKWPREKNGLPPYQADSGMSARDFYFSNFLDLDAGLDANDIDLRVAAVDLLQQYGNLLVAFTAASHDKEIKESADKFAKSVGKFPHNPMTKDEIDGIGQIVTSVGGFLVEHQKKEALEKVVPKVAPLIDKICDSLEKDFDPKKNGIYGNINTVQDRLASVAIEKLKEGPGDSMSDRLLVIDGFAMAEYNKEVITTTAKQIMESIASLRKANSQLVEIIKNNKVGTDDIKKFGEDVAELSKGVKPYFKRF